jgi:hypothetical protein
MVCQYLVTRIPAMRAMAGILPPPKPSATLDPAKLNPSYKETFVAMRDWFNRTADQAKEQAAEQKKRQMIAAAEQRSLKNAQRRVITRDDVKEKKKAVL